MSGHSKWATIKRHKSVVDAKRGKIFSVIAKEITVAASQGGGDPEMNPRLRTLLLKARSVNMPGDNVDRAIKKGTGAIEGVLIEELTYEGFAPGGIGLIIEVTTDNKNRSASDVRSTLSKHGGNLATPGALAHQFHRVGQFILDKNAIAEEVLMDLVLEAGADDVVSDEHEYDIRCPIGAYDHLSHALSQAGLKPSSSELAYIPTAPITLKELDVAKKVIKLIDLMEAIEDVKAVHSSMEIDPSIADQL